jgi:thioredoxin-dependent adenylylsulfate APS reductase
MTAVVDVAAAAAALEGAPLVDVLRWAVDTFAPRITFATSLGAEDCVMIDLIGRHQLAIDLFTLDTGVLFPETYALRDRIEARYGVRIRPVTPAQTIDEQAAAHGPRLWEREPNRCCELRKMQPLRAELSRWDAWITAIRRDQTPDRATARIVEADAKFGLVKLNPLAAWTTKDVWRHLVENEVPYNPLHDHGYPSIGCQPCTSPVAAGEDPRSGRWRGSAKTECGLHALPIVTDPPGEPRS